MNSNNEAKGSFEFLGNRLTVCVKHLFMRAYSVGASRGTFFVATWKVKTMLLGFWDVLQKIWKLSNDLYVFCSSWCFEDVKLISLDLLLQSFKKNKKFFYVNNWNVKNILLWNFAVLVKFKLCDYINKYLTTLLLQSPKIWKPNHIPFVKTLSQEYQINILSRNDIFIFYVSFRSHAWIIEIGSKNLKLI